MVSIREIQFESKLKGTIKVLIAPFRQNTVYTGHWNILRNRDEVRQSKLRKRHEERR